MAEAQTGRRYLAEPALPAGREVQRREGGAGGQLCGNRPTAACFLTCFLERIVYDQVVDSGNENVRMHSRVLVGGLHLGLDRAFEQKAKVPVVRAEQAPR